jgi:ribosomal protein L7Ae-like RNA K-turn-binding protein
VTAPDALTRLLGLGVRARQVVVGVSSVRAGLRRDALACVVLAADASARTREKVERLAVARGVPVLRGPAGERLGAALGRPPVQALGVSDRALARGLLGVNGGVSGNDADS